MKPLCRTALLALTLVLPVSAVPTFAAPSRPVEVVVRLLETTPHGPTRVGGDASLVLDQGETGIVDLRAGVFSDTPPRCAVSSLTGGSAPSEPVGPGYRWRVMVELERESGGLFDLEVKWSRTGRLPGGGDAQASEGLQLRLADGESRHLDFAEFTPIAGDPSCAFEALVLEIEPRSRYGDPAFAHRDLDVEVWFTRNRAGRREEFSGGRVIAAQGERLPLPIEPLDTPLVLGPGSSGRLRTGGRVTVTAWRTGRSTVLLRLEAVVQQRFDPGAVRISSGEGAKVYEARLGETVEIELPPLFATLVVPLDSLGLAGAPADGITVEGDTARVELRRLAGETDYSLLLRVSDGG